MSRLLASQEQVRDGAHLAAPRGQHRAGRLHAHHGGGQRGERGDDAVCVVVEVQAGAVQGLDGGGGREDEHHVHLVGDFTLGPVHRVHRVPRRVLHDLDAQGLGALLDGLRRGHWVGADDGAGAAPAVVVGAGVLQARPVVLLLVRVQADDAHALRRVGAPGRPRGLAPLGARGEANDGQPLLRPGAQGQEAPVVLQQHQGGRGRLPGQRRVLRAARVGVLHAGARLLARSLLAIEAKAID
mmetsp:Transcript_58367/g.151705  ORF Transcript_58367/g.151705 Transcript_58367/m.151705 type:complete len:241 (-) Transcript_58367:861-1583(-)